MELVSWSFGVPRINLYY